MYSTTAYLYQQKTRVLMIDTSGAYFTMRYDPVYAKKLTINKGVDNVILFEFINQDEKPVNITGSTMIFRLISQDGLDLMAAKEMTILSSTLGRVKVTLPAGELDPILAQPASYSISRTSGNLTEPVFTDAQAGARADVDIVDSVWPEFVPSAPLTIPTVDITAQESYGGSSGSSYPDWALQSGGVNNYSPWQPTEYYSSFIEPTGAVTTVQMDLLGYTGTIKAQAAENYQSIWHNVTESTTYLNETKTIHMNIIGYHPLLRLCFNNSLYTTGINGPSTMGTPAQGTVQVNEDGVITGVEITNAGMGYLAAPLVEFVGEGAGAVATATIGTYGEVTGVTIISGGSGYRPVPPTMLQAQVLFSTGYVVNLSYR